MTVDDNFRQNIKLDGLSWTDSVCLPTRFLTFLREEKSLEDKDKIILLRLYTLLQYMDPDVASEIKDLCEKLVNSNFICYSSAMNSKNSPDNNQAKELDQTATASATIAKAPLLDCDNFDTLLMPLFNHLYPEMKDRVYGYKFFIQGELMGLIFPRSLMSLIKYMELTDAQHKKKNVTNHFILGFIFQMVFRDTNFIPDDYFVASRQLNVNQDNLLFALSKTCFEHHEFGVDVTEGKVISEILETDVAIDSDSNSYESATRLYHKLKFGEKGDLQLTDKALHSWETQWKKLIIDHNITIDEIINLLPKLFSERKPEYVPSIFSRKDNDPSNSLGALLIMMRNRRAEKKAKKFGIINLMESS